MNSKRKPIIMISSTVYGIEELLDRIYSTLTLFGYEVWMSHKGTIPVFSKNHAFEDCVAAVEKCDLFLGLITTSYGSGQIGTELSITHQELKRAIELKKPRWLLAHSNVVFARRFLKDLGYPDKEAREKLNLKEKASSITNLKVIDMYEDAILEHLPVEERVGNWVQEFETDEEALLFASSQFSRFQEVEEFLKENFKDPNYLQEKINKN